VIEDAAQAYLSTYRGRPAGSLGDMACFSFHETKNFGCGEGGAFVTNSAQTSRDAEILREKGTNRSSFLRGDVDKYTWVELGSSYLPNEFTSAVLLAQLEHAASITAKRLAIWNAYHEGLADLETQGLVQRPVIPPGCVHNGQVYRILLSSERNRDAVMSGLRDRGVGAAFHFVPLHLAAAGIRYARFEAAELAVTTSAAARLLRLPIHGRMTAGDVRYVLAETRAAIVSSASDATGN
jgi:dTDP-4-amino-4,6-dideoxygalactose transaminase